MVVAVRRLCHRMCISVCLCQGLSLAAVIVRVSVRSGVLWPQLDEPSRYWGDGPLTVPEAINLFLYPSLWRPLLQRHLAQLMVERPDLRPELQSLPQVAQQIKGV